MPEGAREPKTLPFAQTVRFYPRRGVGYRRELDHLALADAETTLCGIKLGMGHSSGTHLTAEFHPEEPFSCRRCVAGLRRVGPVRMTVSHSYFTDGRDRIVSAPQTGS